MPSLPSYAELAHHVVEDAPSPLSIQEILARVHALRPSTTADPRATIRGALAHDRLIARVDDQRFGWKPRVINGAVLRLTLSKEDLSGPPLHLPQEVRDALWPSFFATAKYRDLQPVEVQLPHGERVPFPLIHLVKSDWGTSAGPALWSWLEAQRAKPGDSLLITVVDGEARLSRVAFEPRSARDDAKVAARNQEIVQAALAFFRKKPGGAAIWEISTHLLVTGRFHHPIPPDTLAALWTPSLWEPELEKKPVGRTWVRVDRRRGAPLVASLHEELQTERPAPRRATKGSGRLAQAFRGAGTVYRLKVVLADTRPAIWRRILVAGDVSLLRLHAVLQIAMGWTNSHLHGFAVGETSYSVPDSEEPGESGFEDEREVSLAQVAPRAGDRFTYTYDFGDDWLHEVVVEAVTPAGAGIKVPCLLDGARACPPDDVGGTTGFDDFLRAMRNARHPEHAELVEWLGHRFAPAAFDIAKVNKLLRRL